MRVAEARGDPLDRHRNDALAQVAPSPIVDLNRAVSDTLSLLRYQMRAQQVEAVELLEFNLKQAGFDVIAAADGAEALREGLLVHFAREEEALFPFVETRLPVLAAKVAALLARKAEMTPSILKRSSRNESWPKSDCTS